MPTLSARYPVTCDLVIAFAIALPPDGCVGCLFCRRSRNMKKAQPAYPALCRRGTDCAFNLQVHALPAKDGVAFLTEGLQGEGDRKSTRLNSSHGYISYAVFCLKKKKENTNELEPVIRLDGA